MIQPGEVFNDTYVVQQQIGAGGGGTIYLAYHNRLQKQVAIKKIHDKGTYDLNEVRREADILKNLRHSYLPQVFDFLILDSGVYTVMDYIPGKSLKQIIDSGHKFSEKEIIKYGRQLSEALAYLHMQKPAIIHGDIKPANIMITPEGNVCLIDFNISGVADNKGNAYVMGYSDGYAAPEQYDEYQQILKKLSAAKKAWAEQNKQNQAMQNQVIQQVQPSSATGVTNAGAGATAMLNDAGNAGATAMLDESGGPNGTVMMDSDPNATVMMNSDPNATVMMDDANATAMLSGNDNNAQKVNAPVQASKSILAQQVPQQTPPPTMSSLGIKGIHIDPKSDVYSVGATLYHMLTGQKITEANGESAQTKASDGLVILLNKAMDANPKKRYQNAQKLFEAFNDIYKLDKRYRSMVARQQIFEIIFVVLMAVGVVIAFAGKNQIAMEGDDQYLGYIEQLKECSEDGDTEEFNKIYELAIAQNSNKIDAYLAKANYLFEQRLYEEDIDYITSEVLVNSSAFQADGIDYVYYLLGRCYVEVGDNATAVKTFANAIRYNEVESAYYVESAVALARNDNVDEAFDMLEDAEDHGADVAQIALINAELYKAKGQYSDAVAEFEKCIDNTSDDYMKLNAYVSASDIYQFDVTEENASMQIELLDKAVKDLPEEYLPMVLQREAQAYINLYDLTGDEDAADSAIEIFKKLLDSGRADFIVYNNLVVLYEKCTKYEEAKELLDSIEKTYADSYQYYKRRAFLEFEIQNTKESKDPDFSLFEEYYNKASDLYENSSAAKDIEMMYLDEMYDSAVSEGFLK